VVVLADFQELPQLPVSVVALVPPAVLFRWLLV
jgi:hypothetical protein